MAKSKPTKMLAVLGRCRRGGRWQPAARSSVLAVLGDCHLDMRKALVEETESVKFQANIFLGSVTFIVPAGVEIRPSGMSLLASSRVAVPADEDSTFPVIEVEWNCILGRIRIVSATELGDRQAADGTVIGAVAAAGVPTAVAPNAAVPVAGQVQPMGAQPAAAVAAPAAGFGFEDLGASPSPYAAPAQIPTLNEAMAAVAQPAAAAPATMPDPAMAEPQAAAAPEETMAAPGGFLDFGASDDSDTDDDGDDEPIGDEASIGSESTGAASPGRKAVGGSDGPASQEVGFVDLLAASAG